MIYSSSDDDVEWHFWMGQIFDILHIALTFAFRAKHADTTGWRDNVGFGPERAKSFLRKRRSAVASLEEWREWFSEIPLLSQVAPSPNFERDVEFLRNATHARLDDAFEQTYDEI